MAKMLYLIGGPMGVGKTAVARRLRDALPASVMLDGDWCWDASPFVVTDETKALVLDNICHVLGNFLRCSAYENIVFCWVMHEQAIIDAICRHLPLAETGCEVVSVSLTCAADELRRRIGGDVSAGVRTSDVIERALARLPLYDTLDTIHVDTTDMDPDQVAERIVHLARFDKARTLRLLGERGIPYEFAEHAAVYTVQEAHNEHVPFAEYGAKNLFLRDDKHRAYYLVVLPDGKEVALKRIQELLGSRRLSFASANDLDRMLGLIPGAVTPLGALNDAEHRVEVVIDRALLDAGKLTAHPCVNTATVLLRTQDLIDLLESRGTLVRVIDA